MKSTKVRAVKGPKAPLKAKRKLPEDRTMGRLTVRVLKPGYREARWTHSGWRGRHNYFFEPADRASEHCRREVQEAILLIANDGTLAGIELVGIGVPPPKGI